jgi:hypothetical protein
MSNNLMSYRLTSNYLLGTIQLFEVERFDIKQRARISGIQGVDDMDAVTSFELEAQRRRETIAGDRWAAAWTLAAATVKSVEAQVAERPARVEMPGRRIERAGASPDCRPASAAR